MANYKAELTGVFGYPVAENPTIVMIEAAFQDLNLHWRYLTIEVSPENLKNAITGAKAFQMRGFNLTIPHKINIIPFLDDITPEAKLIGAINTVIIKDGKLHGTNTDGKGFINALKEEDVKIKGGKFMLLGAGGAARAIAVELALAGANHIEIANRSAEKGLDLTNHINENTPSKAAFTEWDRTLSVNEGIDVLVNATSIGLYPDVSSCPDIDYSTIHKKLVVCDVIPNPPDSLFLKHSKKQGAKTIDGLGMLVQQGVIGFKLWTGKDPSVEVMKNALKEAFGL